MEIKDKDWVLVRGRVRDKCPMAGDLVVVLFEAPGEVVRQELAIPRELIIRVVSPPVKVGDIVTWGSKTTNYEVVAIRPNGTLVLVSDNEGENATVYRAGQWPEFTIVKEA